MKPTKLSKKKYPKRGRSVWVKPMDEQWRQELLSMMRATHTRYESEVPLGGKMPKDP